MPVQLSSCGIIFANGEHKCRIEELNEIYVWNTSNWSPQNGGRCCALKYCQVVAQVAHQVVTQITALAVKAATLAKEHCKNQWLVL